MHKIFKILCIFTFSIPYFAQWLCIFYSSKKKSSKKISIKLQKIKSAKGYEVRIATNKKFTGKKVIKIRTKKISFVYKKLKPNKKYYVKARFYRIIKGKKVYGKWGKAKKVTFK